MRSDTLVVLVASLVCVALELFLTRILSLKAWNHVVYVVIPFAILGYGIGANLFLTFQERIRKLGKDRVIALSMSILALTSVVSALALVRLPIRVEYIVNFFRSPRAVLMLLVAYSIFMVPFVAIGFLVVTLFSLDASASRKLYFFDLLGAGFGAVVFFLLIDSLQMIRSLVLLALAAFLVAALYFPRRIRGVAAFLVVLVAGVSLWTLPEPVDYAVDKAKGWEWIPGYFEKRQYETVVSRWHPLGRTNIYRIVDEAAADELYSDSIGTFEINVIPRPEFSYVATDFLAGTPIYKLSPEGLKERDSRIALFTQGMEVPYVLVDKPRVVIIGAGGGRDIFMAKTHGAEEVVGAEINPAIHAAMSAGGRLYDYSGRTYSLDGAKVLNVDGRHLVKVIEPGRYDLVILNGVDTFSGLSTGAYAYAESYLYTKNAVVDYLRVLGPNGMINFNRWLFAELPRETLRLHAIVLEALRIAGAAEPWKHVIIGGHHRWSLMLVKKSPFTAEELETVKRYFAEHETQLLYPTETFLAGKDGRVSFYDYYARQFMEGKENAFAAAYPFDISVVSDDNPFFYKYYRLNLFNPFSVDANRHTGTVIFMTQLLVLGQAVVFIVLFILVPLVVFRRAGIRTMPRKATLPFVAFFACLGLGFMFVEIPVMQRFTLLLGSPIYSLSVTLAALLAFSGIGSLCSKFLGRLAGSEEKLVTASALVLAGLLGAFVAAGTGALDPFMGFAFPWRIAIVCLFLLPLGLCLGVFFPSGLVLAGRRHEGAVAWAWGINCGFSVLGSMLAIVLAQFLGFSRILLLATAVYLGALIAFRRMREALGEGA